LILKPAHLTQFSCASLDHLPVRFYFVGYFEELAMDQIQIGFDSGPSWTDVVQAIAAIGSVLIAVVGFGILIFQIKQLERAIRGDTQSGLYTQTLEIMKFIADNPEIRPYFYEGKELRPEDTSYNLILTATEIVADFFEHVVLQKANLPDEVWQKWCFQIQKTYSNSPVLQEYYATNRLAYSVDVVSLCEQSKKQDEIAE
jgi:hypothetical protein